MRVGFGGGLTVTATDRWLAELRAGRAFSRGATAGAVVGELSHVQLLNPAASGVTILIRGVILSADTSELYLFSRGDTALTTLQSAGINLRLGSAAGLGEVRVQTSVAALGSAIGQTRLLANTPFDPAKEWLAELDAGEGLLVRSNTANVALVATYFWVEL